MDLNEEPQVSLQQERELAEDTIIPQYRMPLPEGVDLEIIKHPEGPQSIWGHRLRQNVRNALVRRGVDMELVESHPASPRQKSRQPQDVTVPEGKHLDLGEHVDDSLSWAQDVQVWPRMFLEDIRTYKPGICKLCTRQMTNITRHHVHPKIDGERRPPLGMDLCSSEYLNTKIDLCRPCHSMIHHIIPNELMSDSYYSLPQVEAHPRVQAWVAWVRRQRIPSPRPQGQSALARVLKPGKRPKAIKHKSREEKMNRNRNSVAMIQGALAKLWSNNENDIPRSLDNQTALQQEVSALGGVGLIRIKHIRKVMARNPEYDGWYRWAFSRPVASGTSVRITRRARLAAERDAEALVTFKIKNALGKMWLDTCNDFPRFSVNQSSRAKALKDAVKECTGISNLKQRRIRQIIQLEPKYRKWFEWTYPNKSWVGGGPKITRSGRVYDRGLAGDMDEEDDGGDSGPDEEMVGANASASPARGPHSMLSEAQEYQDGGQVVVRAVSNGTGSRTDPIVFNLTDDENEPVRLAEPGNLKVSASGGVTIDLTMDDDDYVAVDPVHQTLGGGSEQHGFFFDLGRGRTRFGGLFNT